MIVKIMPNDKGTPPGKLAEAEVHFEDGYFQGLKLVGFAVWERRSGNGRNVTFPARQSPRASSPGNSRPRSELLLCSVPLSLGMIFTIMLRSFAEISSQRRYQSRHVGHVERMS